MQRIYFNSNSGNIRTKRVEFRHLEDSTRIDLFNAPAPKFKLLASFEWRSLKLEVAKTTACS